MKWIKATKRLPELNKEISFRIYERRYAGKMIEPGVFQHNGYACTYGVGSVEWLDESESTPVDIQPAGKDVEEMAKDEGELKAKISWMLNQVIRDFNMNWIGHEQRSAGIDDYAEKLAVLLLDAAFICENDKPKSNPPGIDIQEQAEKKYDTFFGTGYWEAQYKKHIVIFAKQLVEELCIPSSSTADAGVLLINKIVEIAKQNRRFENGVDKIGFVYITQLDEIVREALSSYNSTTKKQGQ